MTTTKREMLKIQNKTRDENINMQVNKNYIKPTQWPFKTQSIYFHLVTEQTLRQHLNAGFKKKKNRLKGW